MAAERTESKDRISGKICVYGHIRETEVRFWKYRKKNKSAVTGCADKRYRMFKGVMACS